MEDRSEFKAPMDSTIISLFSWPFSSKNFQPKTSRQTIRLWKSEKSLFHASRWWNTFLGSEHYCASLFFKISQPHQASWTKHQNGKIESHKARVPNQFTAFLIKKSLTVKFKAKREMKRNESFGWRVFTSFDARAPFHLLRHSMSVDSSTLHENENKS